ncbi:hypothetical protein FNI11_22555 [Salmonella enterica subsp. salamae]|nr:hypothetical protein [Salmonella enterica subsp. salamae]ECJ2283613.1 hypothetical protein [Salmonella enterica subsp. salamae]
MPQAGTRFTVKTDGFDAQTFAVVSFHLVQSYSSLFTLDIHVISDSTDLKATDLLEQNVTLTVWQGRTPQRHITGLIADVEHGEQDGHKMNYSLRVYPPFWRSSLRQNFRHFHQQDIENIVAHLHEPETAEGRSNSPGLWPGVCFTLTDHPAEDLNRNWQVVASTLHSEQPQAVPGNRGKGTTLVNDFQAIPADKTWRPAPLTKPKVDVPQPAVVTGPAGADTGR